MFIKRIAYLVSLLVIQQVAGSLSISSDKNIIDKLPLSIEALNKLCTDSNQRISKVSTVSWLLQQLESTTDPSLDRCKTEYLEPLGALYEVTSQHIDDICSLEKVKLIDQFQWDHQMGAISKKWAKFAKGPLPEPLKVFFLHYVSEITSLCKASLSSSLDMAAIQKYPSNDEASALEGDFGRIVSSFQKVVVPFDKIKHYDNFVLLWDMVINHERKKNSEIIMEDPISGQKYVALVKVKDADKAWAAQQRCRRDFRPVYGKTLLPVMKLIDMGYDIRDKQLDSEIRDSNELRDWYTLTQTCELLLPMKFYGDKSMKIWEIGTLDSFEEASEYAEEPKDLEKLIGMSQVQVPSISLPDELKSALNSDETKLLKLVRANLEDRGHLYRKILRNSMSKAMSKGLNGHKQILSMMKKLKLTGNKQSADDEEIARETMKETDEFLEEGDKLDSELQHNGNARLSRIKRAIGRGTKKFIKACIIIIIIVAFFMGAYASVAAIVVAAHG